MSGWRHLTVRGSFDFVLYTDQSREELDGLLDRYLTDDFLDRFCDCDGECKFDTDEQLDRWAKSRYFPCCRVQCGGCRHSIERETWDEGEDS